MRRALVELDHRSRRRIGVSPGEPRFHIVRSNPRAMMIMAIDGNRRNGTGLIDWAQGRNPRVRPFGSNREAVRKAGLDPNPVVGIIDEKVKGKGSGCPRAVPSNGRFGATAAERAGASRGMVGAIAMAPDGLGR